MNTSVFLPKKINVGFQKRESTYSGKLAYVIYYDEKGVLRKETSWNGWRNHDMGNEEFANEPMEGFVLNKKAGGYASHWNYRQTYVRVYDPRGFEVEISIPNLLYILENTNSIKGKGLEGEFIYGWDGTELLLIPTSAPDYQEMINFSNMMHNNEQLKPKDLIVGATYITKYNEEYVYLGKYHRYDNEGKREKGKFFYFYDRNADFCKLQTMKTLSKNIIRAIDETCAEDYAEIMDKVESLSIYSPVNHEKTEFHPYNFEDFEKDVAGYVSFYDTNKKQLRVNNFGSEIRVEGFREGPYSLGYHITPNRKKFTNLEEVYQEYQPRYKVEYLENGRLNKGRYLK